MRGTRLSFPGPGPRFLRLCRLVLVAGAIGLALAGTGPAQAVAIPTEAVPGDPDGFWRAGLIQRLASFSAADFAIPRQPDGRPEYFTRSFDVYGMSGPYDLSPTDRHQIERLWLLEPQTAPLTGALHIPDACFTKGFVEGDPGAGGPFHGIDTTQFLVEPLVFSGGAGFGWLYAWDYPGNPYFQDPGIRNRAISVLILGLVELDQLHKTRNNHDSANLVLASHVTNPDGYAQHVIPLTAWLPGYLGAQPPAFQAAWRNVISRNDNLALTLEDLANEYWRIRSSLTVGERDLFDLAFVRLGNRLRVWGPWALQYNRLMPAANALFLIARLTGDSQLWDDYLYMADQLYNPARNRFQAAGYMPDDYGWDSSYNGINLLHAGRLLLLERHFADELNQPVSPAFPVVRDALAAMYKLKAHLQLIEPDGLNGFRFSPNHFNARTPGDSTSDQGLMRARPFGAVSFGIEHAFPYLRSWDPTDPVALHFTGRGDRFSGVMPGGFNVDHLNAASVNGGGSIDHPREWEPDLSPGEAYRGVLPWTNYSYGYYRANQEVPTLDVGQFAAWNQDRIDHPEWSLFPIERSGDHQEVLDDEFLFGKFGRFAALVHLGPVSPFEGGDVRANGAVLPEVSRLPGGYGGGMLSYYWDEDAGAVSVGRRRFRYPASSDPALLREIMDNWSQFERWPLHTVWLESAVGSLTTAARILDPDRVIRSGPSGRFAESSRRLEAEVWGTIPGSNLRFGTVLDDTVDYRRDFRISAKGVRVTTTLSPTNGIASSPLRSGIETLPLYFYSCNQQVRAAYLAGRRLPPVEVVFETDRAEIDALSVPRDTWVRGVRRVVQERFGAQTIVEFQEPQTVRLSEEWNAWAAFSQGHADCRDAQGRPTGAARSQSFLKSRNLLIDLLGNGNGLPRRLETPVSVTYWLRPGSRAVTPGGGAVGGDGAAPSKPENKEQ